MKRIALATASVAVARARWTGECDFVSGKGGAKSNSHIGLALAFAGPGTELAVLLVNVLIDEGGEELSTVQQYRLSILPIMSAIPDDPSTRVPIEYRIDAWKECRVVADDLRSGQRAEIFADLAHTGLMAGEIFLEIPAFFTAIGAALAEVGVLFAIGNAYLEAQAIVAKRAAVSAYALGAVCGANQWTWRGLTSHFGRAPSYAPDYEIRKAANTAYALGILTGFRDGRVLTPNQRRVFFADIRTRMDYPERTQSPQSGKPLEDWFVGAGIVFRRDHLFPTE